MTVREAVNEIGLLVRNSTPRQVGNYRSEVQYDMAEVLVVRGFTPRIYDEQGVSGKDLSVRKVTLQMLDDVDRGLLRGIAAEDFKRLTRDQYGIDGAIIARRLADRAAVFVTRDRSYDLCNEDDLLQFQFQCMLAGIDWRSIRNTFWSGIIKALSKGPLFARPPLGYWSETVEIDARGRPIKRAAKCPAHAAVMAELTAAFEECASLKAVLRRLSERGIKRPPVQYNKQVLEEWTAQGIRWMLFENWKLYVGVFEAGGETWRDGKTKRSVVWKKFATDPETGKIRSFTHVVPELAYWTPVQVRRWQKKFSTTIEGPVRRDRKYPHPLLGMLACNACGQPMIGGGPFIYVCRNHSTTGCPAPQTLSERVAMELLRTVLSDALENVADLAQEAQAQLGARRPSAEVLRLAVLEEKLDKLSEMQAEQPTRSTQRLIAEAEQEIDRRREVVADEAEAREEAEQRVERIRRLQTPGEPLKAATRLEPEDLARVMTLLFRNVRIGCEGRGTARRWWLAEYEPIFGDGPIQTLYPHVAMARMLPPARAKKLGLENLIVVEQPKHVEWHRLAGDSAGEIGAYLARLLDLSAALSPAS